MKILAFDTSMGACSVALASLLEDGTVDHLSASFDAMNKGHAEKLLPMIRSEMAAKNLSFDDIDRIAVTLGPGTFTGVRIGVATARGLALASQVPIVSTSSLHVLALTWLRRNGERSQPINIDDYQDMAVVIDARRGDVYLQKFTLQGDLIDDPQMLSIEGAGQYLLKNGSETLLVGNGRILIDDLDLRPSLGKEIDPSQETRPLLPEAYDLAVVGGRLPLLDHRISPLYLRAADAKTQSGKAISRK